MCALKIINAKVRALPRTSTKNAKKCAKFAFVLICALALASCGGGGGGGGTSGASGAGGVRTVSSQELPSNLSNGKNYGIDKNASPITPSLPSTGGTSTDTTPPRGKVALDKPNKQAEGTGIYSEALQSEGVNTVHLELTIDGVTTVHELAGSGSTLQLQTVAPGTEIAVRGTVQTGAKTRNIVQKTYTIESFQDVLPLFVEYDAKFDASSVGANPTTIKYSTDKAIDLPILPDKEVADGAIALFTGWQVSAPGLSIDGNYYERGANVAAGELCGDITFVADYAFGVKFEDDDGDVIAFEEEMLNVIEKTSANIVVTSAEGTDITNSANITLSAASTVATYTPASPAARASFDFGDVGSASVAVSGTTLQGKAYSVQIPINVTELIFDADYYMYNTEFPASTAKHLDQLAKLMKDGNGFDGKTITLDGNITASSTFNGFGGGTKDFAGTFNGDGYTITVSINSYQAALFGAVSSTGTIENLTVAGTITGQNYAAGIAINNDNGKIENCVNNANISGVGLAGGICAMNNGALKHCINTGNVSSTAKQNGDSVGGIAALCLDTGIIENCANTSSNVSISGSYRSLAAGGIVGVLQDASVTKCYTNGTSVSANTFCGGIVGQINGNVSISDCYVANATIDDDATNANPCVGNATTGTTYTNLYYYNTKYTSGQINPTYVSDSSYSEAPTEIANAISLDDKDASGLPIIVVP